MSIYISNTTIDKALLYCLCENTRNQLNSKGFIEPEIEDKKIKKLEDYITKYQIKYFSNQDSDYHYKFLQVPSKPAIIYYIWNIDLLNNPILGVVWPRNPSQYGKKVAHDLLEKAKGFQLVTISWLAPGIDTICHEQSIENNIPTIAILGWWLDYYLRNRWLLIEKIIWNWGLILSEFKIGFKPTHYSFPQRNRIIAWLADVIFLPEASEKSGSLITVDFAAKAGKVIAATPNDIYNYLSSWVNKYISQGNIKAIYDLQVFLKEYFKQKNHRVFSAEKTQAIKLGSQEQDLLLLFQTGEKSIEELLVLSKFDITKLLIILNLLEMKWLIWQNIPWVFKII